MRTSRFRRGLALTAVTALCLSGLASAHATAPQAPASQKGATAAPFPGAYISPWGDAQVSISDETLQWMDKEDITLEAISPFAMDSDGKGFSMPIGSTAGDGLDQKGRIFYPGGLRFHHEGSGKNVTLKPTYIRVMPKPAYSAGVEVDGKPLSDEVSLGESSYSEVMAGARPSPTGFRLEKIPFYVTEDLSKLFEEQTGRPGPRVGSLFGTLTPNFDYVPGKPSGGLPGLPG